MKQFRLVDNVLGWLTFLIAAFVYCSTIEPTASFWDCPEFITTGSKLEVGHPPGAPFFMLTANLFSQFASDPSQVARMVNTMSALLSAACILFLFWSITHLVRRLLTKSWDDLDMTKLIAIEASGLVGALIYTFSDTFWFSAVEGEVYAYSSAFTAVVFWLILKWEEHADEPHSDRWLVLIMYMTGLSIGVHLLNLLCLPAIGLVWYYKRFPNANAKGSLLALLVSAVILAGVLYGVVPGIITVGGWFELFFVNTLHMPFNTGVFIYIILLIASMVWAIYETQNATEKNWKRQNIAFLLGFALLGVPFYGWGWSAFITGILVLGLVGYAVFSRSGGKNPIPLISARLKNTALLCMLMLMIGYSTYAVIVIRSSANPPMDQNSPEDIFTLGSYLSRDQYGYRPLLWGQAYSSELKYNEDGTLARDEGAPKYHKAEKKSPDEPDSYYEVLRSNGWGANDKYVYAQNMLFPRLYSSQTGPAHRDDRLCTTNCHVCFYKAWLGGIEGKQVESDRRSGSTITMPTMGENLRFFLSYQCGYMYWRYFLWNFAGRQNDIQAQNTFDPMHGNFLTGFSFIDNALYGDQSLLPDELKENKGHNVFYCMPLILGLIGLFWQMLGRGRKGIQQFWVVFFLFVMTGLAIVVYLNQTPEQPRERDYAYAGSFYAYAIWCGIGVAAIITWLSKMLQKHLKTQQMRLALASAVSFLCLLVPIQMVSQTWDDHDRSGRYACRDFGQNYLMSLQDEGNPIIFTNGDNDTFPLWYNQDTEGVRTDARVCNLSYLSTDWYIDQMIRPAYESPSLPIKWNSYEYCDGTNDGIQVDWVVNYAIRQFLALNDADTTGVVKKAFKVTPEQADTLFGEDPFELKYVLKNWVRDNRTEEQKQLQKQVLEPIADWYYSIVLYNNRLNNCYTQNKNGQWELDSNAFLNLIKNIGLDVYSPADAANLFSNDPDDPECLYRFLEDKREDKELKNMQLRVLSYIQSTEEFQRYKLNQGEDLLHCIPSEDLYLDIDKDAVRRSGMLLVSDSIPDTMQISLHRINYLNKSQLMMLELLANTNWERPLYVAMTVGSDNIVGLDDHFLQEGLVYRITPFQTYVHVQDGGRERVVPNEELKQTDTETMYNNVMNRFKYGNVKAKGIYIDETVMRMCLTHRQLMMTLASDLFYEGKELILLGGGDKLDEADQEGVEAEHGPAVKNDSLIALGNEKLEKAMKVLDKIEEELPSYNVPYNETSLSAAQLYIDMGQPEKARPILDYLWTRSNQFLDYYTSFGDDIKKFKDSCMRQIDVMSYIAKLNLRVDREQADKRMNQLQQRYNILVQLNVADN